MVLRLCDLGQVRDASFLLLHNHLEEVGFFHVLRNHQGVSMWVHLGGQVGPILVPTEVSYWGPLTPQLE